MENLAKILANFWQKIEIAELCKGVHCVDLGESFQTHIYLQNFASIQPRTSPLKFARSSGRSSRARHELRELVCQTDSPEEIAKLNAEKVLKSAEFMQTSERWAAITIKHWDEVEHSDRIFSTSDSNSQSPQTPLRQSVQYNWNKSDSSPIETCRETKIGRQITRREFRWFKTREKIWGNFDVTGSLVRDRLLIEILATSGQFGIFVPITNCSGLIFIELWAFWNFFMIVLRTS